MFLRKKHLPMYAVAPVLWKGTFLFVAFMILGLGMGYLSSKDFAEASMNWIAEGVNVVGQGCFLWGALALKKAGLEELPFLK